MTGRTLLILVLTAAGPAWGASVFGPDGQLVLGPDGNPLRQTALEASCSASLQRFCPDLSDTPGQTRNEVICLRPYRSSLSLSCRKAVDTAGR